MDKPLKSKLEEYKTQIVNLGLVQFILYKLLALRRRFWRLERPVSLYSKYAKFPLLCRPNTSDPVVFSEVFAIREYRSLDEIRGANFILDCGANVGYSAAYFLSRFPNAYLIAIEPDPGNFAVLQGNLAPYKGRHRALQSAVWSQPAGLVLSQEFRDGREWSRTVREVSAGEEPALMATDIGTLLNGSGYDRISILKVDIEGAEAVVFSSNFEHWIKKVDNLVIELHDEKCSSIFLKAISEENFVISRFGDLTVCKRVSG
jgi:FkbM family methyltransferase